MKSKISCSSQNNKKTSQILPASYLELSSLPHNHNLRPCRHASCSQPLELIDLPTLPPSQIQRLLKLGEEVIHLLQIIELNLKPLEIIKALFVIREKALLVQTEASG